MSRSFIERPRTAIRYVQFDLFAVGTWVGLVLGVLLGDVESVVLRFALGLPFLLFVPGYAFVSALFPRVNQPTETPENDSTGRLASPAETTVDVGERVVLSVVSSILLVPFVGFALNFTSVGVRLLPTIVGVSVVTLGLTVVAAYRRARIPAEERFGTEFVSTIARLLRGSRERRSLNVALNVLLVLGLLLVAASIVYAGMQFGDREPYTEFYVVEENATGELVAGDYPDNLARGERTSFQLVIANHEKTRVNYTVVAVLENDSGGETASDGRVVGRLETAVDPGQRRRITHYFEPNVTGDRLTLVYLLYRDRPPETPTRANAYRSIYLRINVSETGTDSATPQQRPGDYPRSYAVTTPES